MTMRINQNIAAINSQRQLLINSRALAKSLEKLSSGMKVNRAADGPAKLIISEQMRAQIKSVNQAIDNSETAVGMVQTTEAAMNEVTNLLTNMRQLAIASANEGANDANMLEANQLELRNSLNTIDRITANAQFGRKKLLDGSTGANGVGVGVDVTFIKAAPQTRPSPVEGYEVRVFQQGTQSRKEGSVALTQEMVDAEEEITVTESGRTVSLVAIPGDSVAGTLGRLLNEVRKNGLNLEMIVNDDGTLTFIHNEYGSEPNFSVSSSTAGMISSESRVMEGAMPGQDVRGSIDGEVADGVGQLLTGSEGTRAEGLTIRYTGDTLADEDAGDDGEVAGRVAMYQNSLIFQVGPNVGQTVAISMVNTNTRVLGQGVANDSGYRSLQDLDIRSAQGAEDAQKLVDKAIDEVNVVRAAMGAFQQNTLEANLRQLRINSEELTNAESVIRDTDMAQEMTRFTRNSIMMQASVAMLAQANLVPKSVLALLG